MTRVELTYTSTVVTRERVIVEVPDGMDPSLAELGAVVDADCELVAERDRTLDEVRVLA